MLVYKSYDSYAPHSYGRRIGPSTVLSFDKNGSTVETANRFSLLYKNGKSFKEALEEYEERKAKQKDQLDAS